MSKQIYDNNKSWTFKDVVTGELKAAYIPNCQLDDAALWQQLSQVPFTRVYYISKYGKPNRTPRLTWAYGNPNPGSGAELETHYRGLDFQSEIMPPWLEQLSQYVRQIAIGNWNFDPEYNSCIIGRYDDGDDNIAQHKDDEVFLTHHFCANVTLGNERDFQFKTVNPDGTKQTHEICLAHKSVFFFKGLEHGLPVRKRVVDRPRYSISFRNMKNSIGVGNSFYYCRGINGAIDNECKTEYAAKLKELQDNN
ncbi:MAG: alpha-ketoglutarate-dependent dioxygenase AlkB [Nitrosomonas sp.]|nr:alpha-ketoglutarate-dependent dioxygenase AlkB [Nitrosomonas sp.]